MTSMTIVYGEPFEHVALEDVQHAAWLISLPSFSPFSSPLILSLSLPPQTPHSPFCSFVNLTSCLDKESSDSFKDIPDAQLAKNQLSTGYPQNYPQAKSNCHEMGQNEQKERRFIPPTLEQVEAHIKERGYSVVAGVFVAFYESKGWMVGKNKMKDWKAALRTWEYAPRRGQVNTSHKNGKTIEQQVKELLGGLDNVG